MYVKYVCHENICTCSNGLAEPACTQNNLELCDSCDNGFTKIQITAGNKNNSKYSFSWRESNMKSVNPKQRNDFSWKNQVLPVNSGTYCLKHECSCENGVASKYTKEELIDVQLENDDKKLSELSICYFHEQMRCSSCDSGYTLTEINDGGINWGSICKPNICNCNHGTKVPQSQCLIHNSENCQECDPGYFLNDDNKCQRNRCQCPNGNALTGGWVEDSNGNKLYHCTQNGGINCASCDIGFEKLVVNITHSVCEDKCPKLTEHFDEKSEKCVKNVCTCLNGKPRKDCTEHKQVKK